MEYTAYLGYSAGAQDYGLPLGIRPMSAAEEYYMYDNT